VRLVRTAHYTEPLTQLGVRVERLTTDLVTQGEAVWEALADVMYGGRLTGPYDPDVARELRALTRTDAGKVDHPAGGSRDVADAVACSVFGASFTEEAVLTDYLPAQLSDDEVAALVGAVIAETGAVGMPAMGQVMKAVTAQVAGRAEGGRVASEVRRQLSAAT
jgi:hypothetical protein